MTYSRAFLRETSPPARVVFAGFESTTVQLQSAGWQLSMEQSRDSWSGGFRLRLAMKHDEAKLYGLTNEVVASVQQLAEMTGFTMSGTNGFAGVGRFELVFHVQYVSSQIYFNVHQGGPASFQPIDAIPELIDTKIISIEDLVPFRKVGGKEIWLDPANKDELMDHLLKIQSKEQDAIRQRSKARERREWSNTEARPASDAIGQILVGVA